MNEPIYISPSGLATYENCPFSYYLERILKVGTGTLSCNLGFGSAAATAMESFLLGRFEGKVVDPVEVFRAQWDAITSANAMQYKRGYSKEVLTPIGERLMSLFPQAWDDTGYHLLVDAEGKPMVERKLKVDLGNNVILVTKLDLMTINPDGEIHLLDAKTPASPSSPDFSLMGDQLTAYQLAVDAHGKRLGLPSIDGLGYWELIKRPMPKTKRGVGPEVLAPVVVRPRSNQEITRFVEKVHKVAARIRAQDFDKTPRMSWNSPCGACSALPLCSRKETGGLKFSSKEVMDQALACAA